MNIANHRRDEHDYSQNRVHVIENLRTKPSFKVGRRFQDWRKA